MTRSTLVAGTAAVALLAFGGAAWVATRPDPAADVALAAPADAQASAEAQATTAAATASDPGTGDILVRPNSPVLGPAEAPVTVVEFFDPSCEACRAFHPIVQSIREEFPTEVRVVLRYAAFHEGSDEAVRILEAARRQGKFEQVMTALLEKQPEWALHDGPDLDLAWRVAGTVGLDIAQGKADRMLPGTVAILNQDAADAEAAGVQQTPTFFVNGEPLAEFGPEELVEAVRAEVEAVE